MRKYHSPDFRRHHIQECEESKTTIQEYCRENNLSQKTYHTWKKRLNEEKNESNQQNSFIEIPINKRVVGFSQFVYRACRDKPYFSAHFDKLNERVP